jgi:[amino group carrier protein]-lysine/ornithine hydrolase
MTCSEQVRMIYEMVQIPSVTGDEQRLADYLITEMRKLGFTGYKDGVGNAIGEIGVKREGPTIMLLGHMDTVPGQLPVVLDGDNLRGRGAVDAKGPLATMIWAAARAADRIKGRIVVVGAVGEEGTSPGARQLISAGRPDAVVIGEPSGATSVVLGYKGLMRISLDVTRKAMHTTAPAEKAVEVAAEFWHDVQDHINVKWAEMPPFERPSAALVGLQGDLSTARASIWCRTPIGFDGPGFLSWLKSRSGGDSLTIHEEVPAVRSRRVDPVVQSLSAAIRDQGAAAKLKLKLGTSDMNVVGPAWSVPIAAYGPGDSRLCHSDDENISLTEYQTAIDVLTDAIARIAAKVHSGAPETGFEASRQTEAIA